MEIAYLYESILLLLYAKPFLKTDSRRYVALTSMAVAIIYFAFKIYFEYAYYINLPGMALICGLYLYMAGSIPTANCLFLGGIFSICIELGRTIVYETLIISGQYDVYLHYTLLLRVLTIIVKTILVISFRYFLQPYLFSEIGLFDYILLMLPFGYLFFIRASLLNNINVDVIDLRFRCDVLLVTVFSTFLSAVALVFHISSEHHRREIEVMKARIQEQYQSSVNRQEMDKEIMRVYHDLKNQLLGMSSPHDNEQRSQLINQILLQVESHEKVLYSGNTVLDSLLDSKIQAANTLGVTLNLWIEKGDYSFLDNKDICSIVGNALDNAIEAVVKVTDTSQRVIQVKMFLRHGVCAFKVENPYVGQLQEKNKKYLTQKNEPFRHGIGLSSIRYCIEKYGGQMKITTDNQWFALTVTIPVPEASFSV